MLSLPPSAPAAPAALPVATVATPSIAQKLGQSARINQQESLLVSGLRTWQSAYSKATAATTSIPSSSANLFPAYGFLPPVPDSSATWSYGVGTLNGQTMAYVCLSGGSNIALQQALQYASRFYTQNYYLGTACGDATAGTGPVLTLWLQASTPPKSTVNPLAPAVGPTPVPVPAPPGSPPRPSWPTPWKWWTSWWTPWSGGGASPSSPRSRWGW